jgi:hypothetical protein
MSRKATFTRKWAERRNRREFERVYDAATPSMQQELRAIATRQNFNR